jgi:hypothetical protein
MPCAACPQAQSASRPQGRTPPESPPDSPASDGRVLLRGKPYSIDLGSPEFLDCEERDPKRYSDLGVPHFAAASWIVARSEADARTLAWHGTKVRVPSASLDCSIVRVVGSQRALFRNPVGAPAAGRGGSHEQGDHPGGWSVHGGPGAGRCARRALGAAVAPAGHGLRRGGIGDWLVGAGGDLAVAPVGTFARSPVALRARHDPVACAQHGHGPDVSLCGAGVGSRSPFGRRRPVRGEHGGCLARLRAGGLRRHRRAGNLGHGHGRGGVEPRLWRGGAVAFPGWGGVFPGACGSGSFPGHPGCDPAVFHPARRRVVRRRRAGQRDPMDACLVAPPQFVDLCLRGHLGHLLGWPGDGGGLGVPALPHASDGAPSPAVRGIAMRARHPGRSVAAPASRFRNDSGLRRHPTGAFVGGMVLHGRGGVRALRLPGAAAHFSHGRLPAPVHRDPGAVGTQVGGGRRASQRHQYPGWRGRIVLRGLCPIAQVGRREQHGARRAAEPGRRNRRARAVRPRAGVDPALGHRPRRGRSRAFCGPAARHHAFPRPLGQGQPGDSRGRGIPGHHGRDRTTHARSGDSFQWRILRRRRAACSAVHGPARATARDPMRRIRARPW